MRNILRTQKKTHHQKTHLKKITWKHYRTSLSFHSMDQKNKKIPSELNKILIQDDEEQFMDNKEMSVFVIPPRTKIGMSKEVIGIESSTMGSILGYIGSTKDDIFMKWNKEYTKKKWPKTMQRLALDATIAFKGALGVIEKALSVDMGDKDLMVKLMVEKGHILILSSTAWRIRGGKISFLEKNDEGLRIVDNILENVPVDSEMYEKAVVVRALALYNLKEYRHVVDMCREILKRRKNTEKIDMELNSEVVSNDENGKKEIEISPFITEIKKILKKTRRKIEKDHINSTKTF